MAIREDVELNKLLHLIMAPIGGVIPSFHSSPLLKKESALIPLALTASLLSMLANGASLKSLTSTLLIYTVHVNMTISQKGLCTMEELVIGVFAKLCRAVVDRAHAAKESVLVLEHVVEAVSDVFPDGLQLPTGEARKAVHKYAALTGAPDPFTPIVDFAQDDIGTMEGPSAETASDYVAVQLPEQTFQTLCRYNSISRSASSTGTLARTRTSAFPRVLL